MYESTLNNFHIVMISYYNQVLPRQESMITFALITENFRVKGVAVLA